jgi:hypothetical protein
MFFGSVVRKVGESLSNPQTTQTIGNVARGISRAAAMANRASGGTLRTGVEMLPFGSLALKTGKFALEHAQPAAEFLGRAYQNMSSMPK